MSQQDPDKRRYLKLVEYLSLAPGDKVWMLDILSTLVNRNHPFFAKDYVPPARRSAIPEVLINNNDGFYTGLPPSKQKTIKQKGVTMLLTAE